MIYLSDRSLIKISGEDSRVFLQGLITNDINKLNPQDAVYAALLSPQGKYLFDFIIYEVAGDIVLDVEASQAEELVRKLKLYKLRSKVEITVMADWKVYYNLEDGIVDPRSVKLGKRYVTDEEQVESGSLEEYETLRLEVGVPNARDLHDEFILQNNFEQLNGVDFEKGCYVGQEVVARTKYKGGVRKSLYLVEGDLAPFGEKIWAGDKAVAEMRSSLGSHGLAQGDIGLSGGYICAGKPVILKNLS